MADVWLKVEATGWPYKVRLKVLLREESETGKPLSGDVPIRIRKRVDRSSPSSKLGLNDTELVASVVDGKWLNGAEWDYSFWSRKGYDTIVANFQGKKAYWNSDYKPVGSKRTEAAPVPVPTSISKIHFTGAVDQRNPEIMSYAITWTILDQYRKPIAGKVTVVFDGTTETVDSEPDRPGVCFNVAVVDGYGKELKYCVPPPVGEPQIIVLRGPDKPAPTTPKVYAIEADLDSPHPVSGKFIVAGTFSVDGKPADFIATVSSAPGNCKVEGRLGKVEPGTDPKTYKLTSVAGNFKLAVPARSFRGDYLELQITAPNGASAIVPMVKPR